MAKRNGYQEGEPSKCEACGHFIERGQFVHCYNDVGEVHVNCEQPWATPSSSTLDDDDEPMPEYVLLGQPLTRFRVQVPEAILEKAEAPPCP